MPNADARRFKELIEPHLDALFRAAFRLTRSKADAEDLVQETCVRAFLRLDGLSESRSLMPWLLRVMHNLFVDTARRAQRSAASIRDDGADPASSIACEDPSPEERAETAQREEQLQRAWLSLDRGHRALLALRAEGYTLSEIAEITGLSIEPLNARLYRARRSFARHLGEQHALVSGSPKEMAK